MKQHNRKTHTPAGRAATELVLEVFRLNGRLLTAGDRLVEADQLSSARWQVLGAIALAKRSQPVAWLARDMGLHRQGVQRVVNELLAEGLLASQANPHHRRAHLVVLTDRGRAAYDSAMERQVPWINTLSGNLTAEEIAAATRVLRILRDRLEDAS